MELTLCIRSSQIAQLLPTASRPSRAKTAKMLSKILSLAHTVYVKPAAAVLEATGLMQPLKAKATEYGTILGHALLFYADVPLVCTCSAGCLPVLC